MLHQAIVRHTIKISLALGLGAATALLIGCRLSATAAEWKPAEGPLMTRWAKDVSPDNVLPEYPRPQLVRRQWLNLNGLWNFALQPKDEPQPAVFDSKILVPFPVESALSGVHRAVNEKQRLWYRRAFEVPKEWRSGRIRLNFGAVDWETTVRVNGVEVGTHKGGYDAFSFDITDALHAAGEQELVVSVWDPSDGGRQPHGKQLRDPRRSSIRYTATSGIWQTVWLEPVNKIHIRALRITPDIDEQVVRLVVHGSDSLSEYLIDAEVKESGVTKSRHAGNADEQIVLPVKNPKLWSPESPFLYGLQLTLKDRSGTVVDAIGSYFGMRKVGVATAPDGYKRIRLNNRFVFQLGFLDQGFWPDGIYTAPTDEALRYDIETVRRLGCNMVRKHVKIEPQRWYYWCDKLGLLVWQDMVSGHGGEEGRMHFERELKLMIGQHFNHPSIVMWVPFNEGWGQFDTPRIYQSIKKLDPTRLVNGSSGGRSKNVYGDVSDMHRYPGPAAPAAVPHESPHVSVLGEFGGLGLMVKGHTWHKLNKDAIRGFSVYCGKRTDPPRIVKTKYGTGWMIPLNINERQKRGDWRRWDKETFLREYQGLYAFVPRLRFEKGLDAAVYTQLTDVEDELNGVVTYDRIDKADRERLAQIHRKCLRPTAACTGPDGAVMADDPLPPIRPLFDHAVRDTSICVGPDGTYYLTGTTANNPAGSHDKTGWYYVNEGIRLWKSRDLKKWESLGLVWSLEKDATWARKFGRRNGHPARSVWAPEIHYLKGTFWLPYGMNYRGAGLLRSTTGKPEGPYVDIHPEGPFFGGDGKDVSLFQDDDGKVYLVYNKGWIAPLNEDMMGLAGKPRLLKPANAPVIGGEGAFLTKYNGKYILLGAEFNEHDGGRTYDCMAAVADNLYGPYSDRYLAIPHAGHNMLFRTREGQWMSTFFGTPHDAKAIFTEKPAVLPIEFDADGRFRPLMQTSSDRVSPPRAKQQWKQQ